jgi:hypothetical protein
VPFTFQLSAAPTAGAKAISQVVAHFVLSFDLWEEHFSVVETNSARRLASRLSLTAAENWCIDNMTLPVSSLQEHGSVVLRLDIRAEDSRGTSESESKSSLSMAGLIDIFSRKSKDQPLSWSATSAPMRLSDVKQRNMTKPPRSQGGR